MRTISLFATMKESFTEVEVKLLRDRVTRSIMARSARGHILPTMPLVLTGPDLCNPPLSPDHPWRWDDARYAGLMGTAVTSCRRNLGLQSFTPTADGNSVANGTRSRRSEGPLNRMAREQPDRRLNPFRNFRNGAIVTVIGRN